jgi:hypothetical protein
MAKIKSAKGQTTIYKTYMSSNGHGYKNIYTANIRPVKFFPRADSMSTITYIYLVKEQIYVKHTCRNPELYTKYIYSVCRSVNFFVRHRISPWKKNETNINETICLINKGNNKITELRTIFQRESQNP